MKRTISLVSTAALAVVLFAGCTQSNYNSGYNNYNSYNSYNKTDRMAEDAMHDAASQLSAQDIKNINNLK